MEAQLQVYLSINNQFKLKGIESLIHANIDSQANISVLSHPEKIVEVDFKQKKSQENFFIFDCSHASEISNLKLLNLNKNNPNLKTLVFIKEFEYHKIKLYFNLGLKGVLDHDISPKDFVEVFLKVMRGERSLTPNFQKLVLNQYCQKDNSFNFDKWDILNDEFENSFEELYSLTRREKEILYLVCEGKNTKAISEQLFISLHTAETHRRNLLLKLEAKNTAEMVKLAIQHKLISQLP